MEHKGYTITQSLNNHITISKDGKFVVHINCTVKKTDEELKDLLDFIFAIREIN